MGWSPQWEEQFKQSPQHLSAWPWSDLVSFVMRHSRPPEDASSYSVLELGCGAGANIPFFVKLGVNYYAIEGSGYMVDKLIESYPDLSKNIVAGDFTKEIPFDHYFDLIFDRGSLTHNTTSAIKNTISLIEKHLRPGGIFIGIDWFSTEHSDYNKVNLDEDEFTQINLEKGHLANVGRVHFSTKEHIVELFTPHFEFIALEHKLVNKIMPATYSLATWNFAIIKKV